MLRAYENPLISLNNAGYQALISEGSAKKRLKDEDMLTPDNGNDDRNANSGGTIEQISARGMRVITNVIVVPQQILASLSFSPCLISG